ncbi:MAG TPA: tetratricopeptide repeat protein [Proteiniphilum sp.]|nr:tetratricopeptide repeat protein [Proteiniphilum sp.]HPD86025.1 tetratricopeptide repeat protein [Proteiniphilum sp.]HPJ50298.1 tetratricopeptide repeat protein [Proteiniphilum sp.]HPR19840.1 tetratricopeptide repeat protein [Proteiniphilum sp.]
MKPSIIILIILASRFSGGYAQTNLVSEAMRSYRYREALELLERAPESVENQLLKAECYQRLNDFPTALRLYESLTSGKHESVGILTAAADCASQAGENELSLSYCLKARELSPDNLYLKSRVAVAYYRAGDWQGTLTAAEEVFRQDSIPMLLRMAGDAHIRLDDGLGLIYYEKALEKDPADHLALRNLSDIYYSIQLYDSVLVRTGSYLEEIDPERTSIGQLNGMAHYSAGNYPEAIDRLQNNVTLGDSTYTTTYFLGMSFFAMKRYYEAIRWLALAYEQAPQPDVNLLYYYGTALSRTYDRKKGIAVLKEGVEKIESLQEMLFDYDISLAEAHDRSNEPSKAISYYQSALSRRPESYILLYNIALTYDRMDEVESALTYYERFVKNIPEDKIDAGAGSSNGPGERTSILEMSYKASLQRMDELRKLLFLRKGKKSN